MRVNGIKATKGEMIFNAFNYTFLTIIGFSCIFPFLSLLAKSLSENAYVISGKVNLIPKGFQLDAYRLLLSGSDFRTAFFNSVYVTVVGTLVSVFFTACVGYAISMDDLPGCKLITQLYIITMLFSGGIIPSYIVMKATGMINNLLVMIIPGMVSAFNVVLVRNYFFSQPLSLQESARIDGAGNITILFKIMLPISTPVLATIAVFTAVGKWNSYMGPLMYLNKQSVRVLSLFLQRVITAANSVNMEAPQEMMNIASESFRAAAVFVSALPILLVYPFLQGYFVQGMTLGSVKE